MNHAAKRGISNFQFPISNNLYHVRMSFPAMDYQWFIQTNGQTYLFLETRFLNSLLFFIRCAVVIQAYLSNGYDFRMSGQFFIYIAVVFFIKIVIGMQPD